MVLGDLGAVLRALELLLGDLSSLLEDLGLLLGVLDLSLIHI